MANTPRVDPSFDQASGGWGGSWLDIPGLLPVNIGSSDPYPVNFPTRRQYAPPQGQTGSSLSDGSNYDPFGTAIGPPIGDLMSLLTKYLSTKPDTPQVDNSGAAAVIPGLAPVQVNAAMAQPKKVVNASSSQEGDQIYQPNGAQYDPSQFGYQAQPTPINYQYQSGGVTPTVTAQEGDQLYQPTATDLASWAQPQHIGPQTQFNFNGYSTPNDSTFGASPNFTGANAAQAGLNAAGYFVPGLNILAGLGQGFNLFGQAPGTGNTIADVAGTSGMMQDTAANIGNWINRQFGGSYMPDSYAAPTLGGPSQPGGPDWNQAVAAARGGSNAILNGAYGVHPGQDASLGDVKSQLSGLTTLPSFDNTQMGWTGTPLNTNLGGADLYTSMGAVPWSNFANGTPDNGGQGTGPSVDDLNRWAALNATGNRWDN